MRKNKKKFNGEYSDAVISRAKDILSSWKKNSISSKIIVTEISVAVAKNNKSGEYTDEALAYLCALNARVSERYASVISCLIHYFSWKRETRALSRLKVSFGLAKDALINNPIENKKEKSKSLAAEKSLDAGARGGRSRDEEEQISRTASAEPLREGTEASYGKDANKPLAENAPPANEGKEQRSDKVSDPSANRDLKSASGAANEAQTSLNVSEGGSANEVNHNKNQNNLSYNEAEEAVISELFGDEAKDEQTDFIDEIIMDDIVRAANKKELFGDNFGAEKIAHVDSLTDKVKISVDEASGPEIYDELHKPERHARQVGLERQKNN